MRKGGRPDLLPSNPIWFPRFYKLTYKRHLQNQIVFLLVLNSKGSLRKDSHYRRSLEIDIQWDHLNVIQIKEIKTI